VRQLLRHLLPPGARERLWRLAGGRHSLWRYRVRRAAQAFGGYSLPEWRRWQSDIPFRSQWTIKEGIVRHRWRDVPMLKHPIEAALYPLLFWHTRPGTIFEIGSSSGGSAIYFSDVLTAFGVECRILTLDVRVPDPPIKPANVQFLYGDAADLGETLTPDLLRSCPRPWLVIEDASHEYRHTLAVLRFFDPMMQSGEYLVVEDANVTDMGDEARFDGGPGRAIAEFLADSGHRYEIDRDYCDRFGHNFTGNPNGYLRRR
jgi:cephalosporin hydroxylase